MDERKKLIRRMNKFASFIWQERRVAGVIFLCSILLPLANIPLPFIFKKFINAFAYEPKISNILWASLWLGIAYIIVKIGAGLRVYFTQKYRERTTIRLKDLFFSHFIDIELGHYTKHNSGYFLGRFNEVENLKDLFVDQFGGAISAFTLAVISFVILLYFSVPCAFIFLACVPIGILGIARIRKQTTEKGKTVQEARARFTEEVQEYLQNIEKIKIFDIREKILNKFKKVNEAVYQAIVNLTKWQVRFNTSIECVSIPFFILAFIVLGISVVQGERTVGDLMAVNQFGTYFLSNLLQLAVIIQQVFVSLASFERVFDILEQKSKIKEGNKNFDFLMTSNKAMNIKGEGIYFKYPEESEYVLKGVNFEIKAGEKIIIAGPSGSGKTTIFKLITRLYDPQKGFISIGDNKVNELKFDALRKVIAYIPQEPFLLKGTLMDNLKLSAPNREEMEIKRVLKSVNFGEVFESLPNGYETYVQEMGRGLSGGQRQMLNIARIFLTNPNIILLDEPTSWQDPFIEKLVIDSILKIAESKIVVLIAHKPSTILMGDRVIVVNKGEIIDTGNHNDLLKRNETYAVYFTELKRTVKNNIF